MFNAALVTPTYYVYFTTTTIISSAILFRGFKGTPTSIITVVNGFLTICSGVVLLQLSKSAKDVPDAAVFAGDLDQIQTIAEQPQSETEPKADAIRGAGAASIIRRLSSARQKMEIDELKRLHEEKLQEGLAPVNENGVPQYEWDGIRRRRTGTVSSYRARPMTSSAATHLAPPTPTPQPHPPLGWSHFPTEEELAEANRSISPAFSNLMGTIRGRARTVTLPGHSEFASKVQSPMHPVQLTSIAVPGSKPADDQAYDPGREYSPPGTAAGEGSGDGAKRRFQFKPDNRNASAESELMTPVAPAPPPHSARRQFSFQNMFRRQQDQPRGGDEPADAGPPRLGSRHGMSSRGSSYPTPQTADATEEERLGLVQGNSSTKLKSIPALHEFDDDGDDDDIDDINYTDDKHSRYGHSITKGYDAGSATAEKTGAEPNEAEKYRQRLREQRRGGGSGSGSGSDVDEALPRPPPQPMHGDDGRGSFI